MEESREKTSALLRSTPELIDPPDDISGVQLFDGDVVVVEDVGSTAQVASREPAVEPVDEG